MINPQKTDYKFGYWYLNHKEQIKNILKYIGIIIVSIIWLNLIIKTGGYLLNIKRTNNIYANLVTSSNIKWDAIARPTDIIIIESSGFSKELNKYDLFAHIKNPNKYWGANITYQFNIPGASIEPKQIFILPGQELYLTELDLINVGINSLDEVSFKILDPVNWKGIKGNIPSIDFLFNDTIYGSIETGTLDEDGNELTESSNYSRILTSALNNSIYGFKNVKITVLLKSQNQSVGVSSTYLTDIYSGEERELEFIWPRRFPFNVDSSFNIQTDVLDENNLIEVSKPVY